MGSRRQQVANRRTHRFSDTSDNSDRLSKLQHLFIGSPNKSLARSKVTATAEALACGLPAVQFANPSVTVQQIECEKARRVPTVKHQVFELRSGTSIQGTNFAINDRS